MKRFVVFLKDGVKQDVYAEKAMRSGESVIFTNADGKEMVAAFSQIIGWAEADAITAF